MLNQPKYSVINARTSLSWSVGTFSKHFSMKLRIIGFVLFPLPCFRPDRSGVCCVNAYLLNVWWCMSNVEVLRVFSLQRSSLMAMRSENHWFMLLVHTNASSSHSMKMRRVMMWLSQTRLKYEGLLPHKFLETRLKKFRHDTLLQVTSMNWESCSSLP